MSRALHLAGLRLLFLCLACVFSLHASAADLVNWPSQYTIRPWESDRLTAADVVGPDGIVYPDFTGVGVTGGVPDINNATVRATYAVFNVRDYGALGDGATNDDDAVAATAAAVRAHLSASSVNKAILHFPAGTYVLSAPVAFTTGNLVIDGDGPDSTVIKLATDPAKTGALFTLSRPANFSGYLVATAFAPRGSNTLTLNADPAANSFAVGSWVRLAATVSGSGKTISDRFSNPDNHVVFTDAYYQTGRITFAKITAINSAARTVTLDRTFTHDYFVDESPQLRRMDMLENAGLQDLAIETVAATATLDPVRFENAANSWIKNIRTVKARDWPVRTVNVTRFEIRDSQFLGTWNEINQGGGVAYLGRADTATDSLMDNCQASDLRHMAIFMMSNRCVIRGSTFTGKSVQSPQLHGRFPHENLIETTTFDTRSSDGTGSTRGITSFGSDGAASMVHGVNGPRNVYYNNTVASGMGTAVFGGVNEGFIFAYNRILKTNDTEAKPAIIAMNRTFDLIVRGNLFQAISTLPAFTLGESTCTGWNVTDNRFYGTNGYLYEGDSAPEIVHNNRFFPASTTPPAATSPEVPSIYAWQKANAATPRLVLAGDRRVVTDTGGVTELTVVRVRASTASSLTVALSASPAGLSLPASVTIPAGQSSATFLVTGANVTGEQLVTVTASAPGLLSDTETLSVLDQGQPQPNFGGLKWPEPAQGLPDYWKAGNYGIVSAPGSQSFANGAWTLVGAGVATQSYHASLSRGGRKFVYQTVLGDGEIRARLASASGDAQVGLLIADDEANHTDFIWVEANGRVFGSSNDPETGMGNGFVTQYAPAATRTVPVWLRLKRAGSVFTAYRSTVANPASESDWTVLATVDLYLDTATQYKSPAILDQRMHFGLFVNSGSATNTATATFTDVAFTGLIDGATPPLAPSALSASLSGANATLAWTDNSADESAFQLETRLDNGAWQTLATLPANTTTFQHAGLLDGVTYTYRVRATRTQPAGTSSYSNLATASRPASTIPLAPSALSATADAPGEIQLAWTDHAYNETGFTIERSTTPDTGFATLATLGANATGYTDAALPEGARFYYRVRAANTLGASAYSNETTATTRLLAPASPFVAESGSTFITLAWADASSAESGYRIERRPAAGGDFTLVGTTAANAASFTDTTVAASSAYVYRIQAFNTITASAYTAEVQATAASETFAAFYEPFDYDTAVSTSIIGQFGSGRGSSGIWRKIFGNNPADLLQSGSLSAGGVTTLGNHLRLGEVTASTRIGIALDNSTREIIYPPANGSRTFWVSFLCRTPGTLSGTYTPGLSLATATHSDVLHFQTWTGNTARRHSLAGDGIATVNSANSTVATNTTYLYVARVTLADTNGNAGDGVERVGATLWQFPSGSTPPSTPPADATGITLPDTNVSSRLITRLALHGANSGSANAFLFDEIRIGRSYPQVALTTPPAPLGRPEGVTAAHLANGSLRLRWLDNANAETGYQIERRQGPAGSWSLIATTTADAVAFNHTPPSAAQEFFFRLRAVNAGGQGPWSDPVAILSPGVFTDPASLAHTQPANRATPVPILLHNRASVSQTFTLTAASGGPAYALSTSNQPGGPAYVWNDISATGTVLSSLNGQDDTTSTELVPIGFSFPFYGSSFTALRVATNGWLSFDSSVAGGTPGHWTNTILPNNQASVTTSWLPPSSIAFLWDDLKFDNTSPASRAYYRQVDADTLVLQFSNVRHFSDATIRLNLQVHLKRNGDILIYYRDGSLNDHSYTIGIQNASRTQALQASYNSEYVSTNFALRFRPPATWLTVSPAVLTLPAQSSGQIVPTLDSTGLASGTSDSFLSIRSDYPGQPAFEVPVSLTVSDSASFPPPPANLVATSAEGVVTLSWLDLATTETGYELQRSRDQLTWQPWALLPPGATSATDSSGATGTLYYRVRATGSPTASPWSPSASVSLTSIPGTFSLSGTVTYGGAPLPGATVSAGGRSATTDSSGAYEIAGLPPGAHTLVPSADAYGFTPASRSQSLTNASVSGLNFTATQDAEITLSRASTPIPDGGTDSVSGTTRQTPTQLTYTFANSGLTPLTLSTASVSAATNCSVSILTQPATTLSHGASTSLVVTVTPSAGGPWSFRLSLPNSDSDENPYDWTVSGTVPLLPPVLTPGQSASGTVGRPFTFALQATNTPSSYAHVSGTLPPGLSLNTSTGMLVGTPTTPGTYTPAFTATNTDGTSLPATVTLTIDNGVLLVHEPFAYTLATTNPDPDAGLNTGNGLPATNLSGTPSGTSTGLRGNWGADQTVRPGLTYENAGGALLTSGGALRQNTGTGWGAGQAWLYRNMSSDPFAAYRSAASANWFGWNGAAPTELYLSVLLNTSATGAANNRALTLITGQNNAQWSVYLRESGGNWVLNDQAGANRILGPATANQTAFVVLRYTFASATTLTIDAWLNPRLGAALGAPTGTLAYTTLTSGGDFRGFQTRNDTADILTIDELRLGTTAFSVMPYAPPLTPLQIWTADQFGTETDPLIVGPAADPDADGLPNLLEYAFGSDPLDRSGAFQAPTPAISASRLQLTFTPQVTSGLRYHIDSSSDLVTWTSVEVTSLLVSAQPYTFTDTADLLTTPRRFLRLRITSP